MDENKSASELNEALKGMWDSLTDEQREKAKACKSMDELTALAGKLGVELPDETLDKVAGGGDVVDYNNLTVAGWNCPHCGESEEKEDYGHGFNDNQRLMKCLKCNNFWIAERWR